MRIWLSETQTVTWLHTFFETKAAAYLFSYGGLGLDLLIFPLLLWYRTRWLAFVLSASFHLMNAALFNIGIFPWLMIGTLILFLPSTQAHQRLQPSKILMGFLALFFLLQLLIPLRHHLYATDVKWSEEGHLFAWRMKLNDRETVHLLFTVSSPNTICTGKST